MIVPVEAAVAGSGIDTTRPISDVTFEVGQDQPTTTRPLSDAAFAIRAA